jgi:hypothetical protein
MVAFFQYNDDELIIEYYYNIWMNVISISDYYNTNKNAREIYHVF